MSPYALGRVLVAVDFGEASKQALLAAGLLAERSGAALEVLHAESPDAPAYFTHEQVEALAAQRARMEAQARAYLATFARAHTRAPFTATLASQPAADAILHHVGGADLAVMGTHGRHGPRRWWLGSVAERVLQAIDRPLLVVHAADRPAAMFERVGVFAGPGVASARAVDVATALAAPFGAPVDDRRGEAIDASSMHDHATLVVVAAPFPHDRRWLSALGEPLIRSEAGPVVFVPDGPISGVHP
jgi:nucleotide-binding universal stress UspA family protein